MRSRSLIFVWIALLGLLAISVAAALGMPAPLGHAVSLACAAAMAGLILAAFMGLESAGGIVRLFALGGLLWLAFLLLLTLADTLAR